jgi:Tol biopolymer transport system component
MRSPLARAGVAAVAGLALAASMAAGAKDDLELVSRGSTGLKTPDDTRDATLSGNGRFVAFTTDAALHPDDGDSVGDVYVRDRQLGATVLVSRANGSSGTDATTQGDRPSISADGRYVAFDSTTPNLAADDPDGVQDVFVRDLTLGTTVLVSRATGASGAKAGAGSLAASISADGRTVAFTSTAINLDPADSDTQRDVFVRDLDQSTTYLASRADTAGGANADQGANVFVSLSGDGRRVAWSTTATNLGSGGDTGSDVFVRDIFANTTVLASRADGAGGAESNGTVNAQFLSETGRHVVFQDDATNLGVNAPGTVQVYVRDLDSATTTLATRASGVAGAASNGGGASVFQGAISADGRYVAFGATGSNLHPDDGDAGFDIFVRDLQQNTTSLISRAAGPTGAKANDESFLAHISSDGRFVLFDSLATNLHADDTDALDDLYVRDVLGAPATTTTTATTDGSGTASTATTSTPPPSPGPPPAVILRDTRAPLLVLRATRSQRLGAFLRLTGRCDEPCTLAASATLSIPGAARVVRLRRVTRRLARAGTATLRIAVPRSARRSASRALRRRRRVIASVTVRATDAATNARVARVRVRLRR